jgi:hypothetical protein
MQLSAQSLNVARGSRGLTSVLYQLSAVANDAFSFANAAFNSTIISYDASSAVTTAAEYIDVLHNASFAAHGPIYFFARLARLGDMVGPDEAAGGGGVFVGPNGQKWSGSRICLVSSCITTTINAINKAPLSASAITGGTGGFSLSVSRETLMFVPFLFPIVIALIALVAALGFWGKTWQSIPACCSALAICAVLPWM